MAPHNPSAIDSQITKSVISSPPSSSDYRSCDSEPPVRFMCSFGGQILPGRHNANQLCYVGGNTHIVVVERYSTFPSLLAELSDLCGNTEITVKYHLPNEDLDALISVTKDEDVENMIVEHDRFIWGKPEGSGQLLRLFLFPRSSSPAVSQTNEAVPPPVQVMCSFGGQILPRRHNANQLCYVGGNTHILTVERYSTFPSLLVELSDLCGNTEITVKYHLPNEDLDALISVTKDKDVENMIVEYDRFIWGRPEGSGQLLRLFLFPRSSSPAISQTNEAVPPSVMERDFLKLEALQEDTLGSTSIPLQSRRAIGTVPQSVTYEILDPSVVWPQQDESTKQAAYSSTTVLCVSSHPGSEVTMQCDRLALLYSCY